jgi:hypothetical protein
LKLASLTPKKNAPHLQWGSSELKETQFSLFILYAAFKVGNFDRKNDLLFTRSSENYLGGSGLGYGLGYELGRGWGVDGARGGAMGADGVGGFGDSFDRSRVVETRV